MIRSSSWFSSLLAVLEWGDDLPVGAIQAPEADAKARLEWQRSERSWRKMAEAKVMEVM
jgi:hypothetical protein